VTPAASVSSRVASWHPPGGTVPRGVEVAVTRMQRGAAGLLTGLLVAVGGCARTAPARPPVAATPPSDPGDIGRTLVTYDVVDGALTDRRPVAALPDELVELRDDQALHGEAWSLWWALAPEPWRDDVTELLIATDGDGGILASVTPRDAGADTWTLHVDPAELHDEEELEETMVHELAHVLSLGGTQLRHDPAHPWGYATLADARAACGSRGGVEDGCFTADGYLGDFVARYWDDELLGRADAIAAAEDPEAAATALFDEDPDRFATDYAALHPAEDFAESWVTFVLYEYEDIDEEWARKAAWFEAHPELVAARDHIWALLDIAP
jgi:hypothetical protein